MSLLSLGQSVQIDSLQRLVDKEGDTKRKVEFLNQLSFTFFGFDSNKAGASAQLALELSQKIGDKPGEAWATAYRGVYFLFSGSLNEARQKFVQSLKFGIELHDNNLQAYSLIQLGNIFRDRGIFDSSYNYYKQAETVMHQKPDLFYQSIVKMNLGRYYLILSKPDSALLEVSEALRLRESMKDPSMLPDVWILVGNCYREKYDLNEAERYYNKARSAAPSSSSVNEQYLVNLGEIYFSRGDFQKALKNWTEVLAYNRKLNDKFELARLLYRMGEAFEEQGYYVLAIESLSKSLAIAEESSYQYLGAEVYYELAWVFYRNMNLTLASQNIEKAQVVFKRVKQELRLSSCLNVKGLIQMKKGNFDSSLYYHQLSLRERTRIGDKVALSSSLFNIGELFANRKEYTKALAYLWRGAKIDESIGDNNGRSSYYYQIGKIYNIIGYFDSAKFYLDKALKFAIPSSANENLRNSYFEMADFLQKSGKPSEANSYYRKFIELSDSISSKQTSQSLASFRTLYEVGKKEQEIDLLIKDNLLAKAQAQKQQVFFYVAVSGLFILIVLAIFYNRFVKRLRKLNYQILEKNEEVQTQSEELTEANQALTKLNEELESSNVHLKDALDALCVSQEQLIQAEKMASLGVLSSGVAHELNNPLNFIKGGVNALQIELKNVGEDKEQEIKIYVDIINEGVNRASVILKGLGHFSRQSGQQDEACDIHKIIDNCLMILNSKLKHKVIVEKAYSSDTVIVSGNEGKLHQAFLNILANAEQAIKEQGTIRIETMVANRMISISISDTGSGIVKENLSKIGDPFFTTKAPGEGTGLGLSITYKIIEEHQGEISVESELNRGTKFLVSLPLNK